LGNIHGQFFFCHKINKIAERPSGTVLAAVNPNDAGGLFAGNAAFLTTQLFAVAVVGAYAFLVSLILLKIIDAISGGLRVSHENEVLGLDQSAHSETAYNM